MGLKRSTGTRLGNFDLGVGVGLMGFGDRIDIGILKC